MNALHNRGEKIEFKATDSPRTLNSNNFKLLFEHYIRLHVKLVII